MKLKNVLAAVAVAGVFAAPIAAQAGTAASAALPKAGSLSSLGHRQSAAVQGKQKAEAGVFVLGALGVTAVVGGVIAATKSDNKSNGA